MHRAHQLIYLFIFSRNNFILAINLLLGMTIAQVWP